MKVFILFYVMTGLLWSSGNMTGMSNHKKSVKIGLKIDENSKKQQLWTCSMHPQIKMEEKGKCPICLMDLIPLISGNVLASNVIELSENQQKSAGILTYPVLFEHDQKNLNLYGRVKLIPSKIYKITAWVGGRIDKLYISSIGEKIKIGDSLYKIYSPSLIASQQELIQAISLQKKLKLSNSRFLSLKNNIQAIRQKLLYLGLTKGDLKKIEKQKKPSTHIIVRAKKSGIVRKVIINEGEYVKEGSSILLIADMRQLWVEASVYEDDVQTIHGDIRAFILLDSHPKDEIIAKLVRIDPFVNLKTRASRAIFLIDNKDGKYHEDSFARVQIESHSKKGLLVPHSSALFTGQKALVFVKNKNKFKSVFVRILEKTESYYKVLGNLKVGDEVVAEGTFKIDSEFQIQAKDSMMSAKELASPYGSRLDLRSSIQKAMDWLKIKKPSNNLKERLSGLRDLYIELQTALAESSFDESKDILKEIDQNINNIKTKLLEVQENQVLKLFKRDLKKPMIKALSSKVFKDLHTCFSTLSQWMIAMSENLWLDKDEDLKKMFCPMAFNKKGAFWIQEDDEVMNPYFGIKMQQCGEQKKWSE
ncbi:MAG: hypothetical protein COB02_11480 [Candidatus Cloacimonadota bacterium]|nr:MAG: hypothetical protein COB02_11480 [Candidatus Cloacimonadota bacterium]